MDAHEAAIWAFWNTDSFEQSVLEAVNLGDDADTTCAIYGQFAVAYYGHAAIPEHWRQRIMLAERIAELEDALLGLAQIRPQSVKNGVSNPQEAPRAGDRILPGGVGQNAASPT